MRLVRPHVNERYELRFVESEETPWLADAMNGLLTALLVLGPVAVVL
jgi:hypothetical protein